MNKNKIANVVLAGVLALAVIGIGYSAYRQKIQADTIVPGYATLHLGLKLTIPTTDAIRIKAVAYPARGGKKYYFKERDFSFESAGINNIEWYIRKIPAGNYKVMVTSSSGVFNPESQLIDMTNDVVSERLVYELFVGEPLEISTPVIEPSIEPSEEASPLDEVENIIDLPTPSPTATASATSDTSPTNGDLIVPPVPSLPVI